VLSLLGITIGIFSIISIFTVLNSMERAVRESVEALGDNVVYVQKWPWGTGGEYQWWRYMNRPQPSINELNEIRTRSQLAGASAMAAQFNALVTYQKNSAPSTSVRGVSSHYEDIQSFDIEFGRYFSGYELHAARNVAVIGSTIAEELLEMPNPIGQNIKVNGRNVTIIGVLIREGDSAIGEESHDRMVIIPISFAQQLVNLRRLNPWIMVQAGPGITTNELKDELRGILRTVRRIKPLEDDSFALNEIDLIKQGLDNIFRIIDLAGFIIGGFSIIVGGFGIANIMFVSVKERTSIIGIQKALGAKRYFILLQFLYEAVLLSILGGIIGLLLILAGTILISHTTDFTIHLTIGNTIMGLVISSIIGIISGFAPAWTASRLNPVEAINTKA